MEPIKNINQLKTGQKLIKISNGEVKYYEFLMIHPHNPEYIFCINLREEAEKFYKTEVYSRFFTNYTESEIFNIIREYALKTIKECDIALKELGDKNNLKE